MSHDIFISYAKQEKVSAEAICVGLENHSISCWIAPRDIVPGESWGEAIINAITESHLLVLVYSSNSNQSPHVMREVERAVSNEIPIIPIRLEDFPFSKSLEFFLSSSQWLDAFDLPLSSHISTLADAINQLLSKRHVSSETQAVSETRTTYDPNDEATLRELYVCFDRPAFKDSFRHETDLDALMVAIDDMIAAINTGIKRRRDGIVFGEPVKGKAYFVNDDLRESFDEIVEVLVEAKRVFVQAAQEGYFFDLNSYETYDPLSPSLALRHPTWGRRIAFHSNHSEDAIRVAVEIDALRNRVLQIANSVFATLGLAPFPYIETSDWYVWRDNHSFR